MDLQYFKLTGVEGVLPEREVVVFELLGEQFSF
jgi:hypothetical protein